jgi:hypothetical protein
LGANFVMVSTIVVLTDVAGVDHHVDVNQRADVVLHGVLVDKD